jgi:hypothetical protein
VVAAPFVIVRVFVKEPPAATAAKSSGVGAIVAVRPVAVDVGGMITTV